MNKTAFYASLNCPLLTQYRWSAFNAQARRAVFSIWADELQGGRYVMWPAEHQPYMDTPNAEPHRKILEEVLVATGKIEVLGIWQEAKDIDKEPRSIRRFDRERVLILRLIKESNGDIVAVVVGEVGIEEARAGSIQTQFQKFDSAVDDMIDLPLGAQNPDRVSSSTTGYRRDPEIRAHVIKRSKGRCEFCSEAGFEMPDGSRYVETHHIISLAKQGADTLRNVIALCAEHHRESHYGKRAEQLEAEMIQALADIQSDF